MYISPTLSIVQGPRGHGFVVQLLKSFDMGETYERFYHPAVWTTPERAKKFVDHMLTVQKAQRIANQKRGNLGLIGFDTTHWRTASDAVRGEGPVASTYCIQRTADTQPAWYSPLCQGRTTLKLSGDMIEVPVGARGNSLVHAFSAPFARH